MKTEDILYEGKAKIIYKAKDSKTVLQYFKDDTTAFNKQKFEIIAGKGEINCQISGLILNYLAKNGIKTHLIKQIDNRTQECQKLQIIPLEVIVRNIAAGSFAKNYGIETGKILAKPSVEFSYKKDELHDPLISPLHIEALEIATKNELDIITETALKINILLQELFAKINFTLVDFKIEFGKNANSEILLADEISPDSCRLWDKDGKSFDKDVFRKGTGNIVEKYAIILQNLSSFLLI